MTSAKHAERFACASSQMIYIRSFQKLQEMESESCAQQRAQESLLAAVCQTLKEEHKAKLQRLQKDTTQVQETPEGASVEKAGGWVWKKS